MRAIRLLIGLTAASVLLAACDPRRDGAPPQPVEPSPKAETPTAVAIGYACESGRVVSVRYIDAGTAEVVYEGQTHPLRTAPAASGARYAGAGLSWHTATRDGQESAILSRLGPNGEIGGAVLERCGRPASGLDYAPGPVETPAPAPGGVLPASIPCRGPQLRLTAEGADAGAGNRAATLALTNAGAQPCSLTGYPTVALEDAAGRPVAGLQVEQSPGAYLRAGQVPAPVELAPQGRAFFDVFWNVVPHEGQGERACPSVARLRVTAPGDTAGLSLEQALTPCGGRVRVSPLRAVAEPAAAPAPAT